MRLIILVLLFCKISTIAQSMIQNQKNSIQFKNFYEKYLETEINETEKRPGETSNQSLILKKGKSRQPALIRRKRFFLHFLFNLNILRLPKLIFPFGFGQPSSFRLIG